MFVLECVFFCCLFCAHVLGANVVFVRVLALVGRTQVCLRACLHTLLIEFIPIGLTLYLYASKGSLFFGAPSAANTPSQRLKAAAD